jgi:hypothetical protein
VIIQVFIVSNGKDFWSIFHIGCRLAMIPRLCPGCPFQDPGRGSSPILFIKWKKTSNNEFEASQDYTVRHCLKKEKKRNFPLAESYHSLEICLDPVMSLSLFFFFFFFSASDWTQGSRVLHMLAQCCTTELHPQSFFLKGRFLLCSLGWPPTLDPLASASHMMGV